MRVVMSGPFITEAVPPFPNGRMPILNDNIVRDRRGEESALSELGSISGCSSLLL